MKFQVYDGTKELPTESLIVTIYGDAGVGKTSLANTCKNAVLIDTDNGSQRAKFNQSIIRMNSWSDIQDNIQEFNQYVSPFDTIIIDTVGTLLDYINTWLIHKFPKLETANLQRYGELKRYFEEFNRLLRQSGKNIIFIAHAKEKEENEQRRVRPSAIGSSYELLCQQSDFIGYMHKRGNDTILDFDAREWKVGKNPAALETIVIPPIDRMTGFMQTTMDSMRHSLQTSNAVQQKVVSKMLEFQSQVESIATCNGLNKYMDEVRKMKLTKAEQVQIWDFVKAKGTFLNCEFDKDSKTFKGE